MNPSRLPVTWRKSSYSTNGGDCVEVGIGPVISTPVRDSKRPDGPTFAVSPSAWSAFVATVKAGAHAL
ncbi:DUF397 domain-containing protein [Streptomyces luteireticuli]|uniref:DUF397 domain-containing protein n=1 Tax=Streptomyces luteireticuli TaxID=173858 RepID=UPI0035585BA5